VGKSIRIKGGPFKGYKGRVTEVKGSTVRVELDSQMKNVTGIASPSPSLSFLLCGNFVVY
jgi:transcription elongation factor SPT5